MVDCYSPVGALPLFTHKHGAGGRGAGVGHGGLCARGPAPRLVKTEETLNNARASQIKCNSPYPLIILGEHVFVGGNVIRLASGAQRICFSYVVDDAREAG